MKKEQVEQLIGKKIVETISFPGGETFEAYDKAIQKLRELGVSYGSMQRGEPIGLAYGEADISKWRNLGPDVKMLDGLLIPNGSFREGGATIYLAARPTEG